MTTNNETRFDFRTLAAEARDLGHPADAECIVLFVDPDDETARVLIYEDGEAKEAGASWEWDYPTIADYLAERAHTANWS